MAPDRRESERLGDAEFPPKVREEEANKFHEHKIKKKNINSTGIHNIDKWI